MDGVWIGQKLMGASGALTERFLEALTQAGPGTPIVASICRKLLFEIGLSLILEESDTHRPFARTRGMLRLPTDVEERDLVQAFNVLGTVTSHFVVALPGATVEVDRFVRDSIRHATRVTLQLRRELLTGKRGTAAERLFGGVALIAFPPRQDFTTPVESSAAF